MSYICKRFNLGGLHFTGAGSAITEPRNLMERMVWSQIKTILHHFSNNPIFDRTNTNQAMSHIQIPPITEDRVTKLVDYAIAKGWGQKSS